MLHTLRLFISELERHDFLEVWKSSHPLSPKEKGIWERGLGLAGRSENICDPREGRTAQNVPPWLPKGLHSLAFTPWEL